MKPVAEAMEPRKWLVGEHCMNVECIPARCAGVHGKANVGISNDKGGAMPPRRKTKVSRATLIVPGLVGS